MCKRLQVLGTGIVFNIVLSQTQKKLASRIPALNLDLASGPKDFGQGTAGRIPLFSIAILLSNLGVETL